MERWKRTSSSRLRRGGSACALPLKTCWRGWKRSGSYRYRPIFGVRPRSPIGSAIRPSMRRVRGAVAAPTAGLHFTPQLIAEIAAKGVAVLKVLLHVGPGTFEPVRCADPRQHVLEPEYCEIDESVAAALRRCRAGGGRIVAVGTTVVRTLESSADAEGNVCACGGLADAFIYPPYTFKAVDTLVTNFHLPRSSLLLLVAAFVGRGTAFGRLLRGRRAGLSLLQLWRCHDDRVRSWKV